MEMTLTTDTLHCAISGSRDGSKHKWAVEDLGAWCLLMEETFQNFQVLSVAMDAGRMGRPKEETMLFAISDGYENAWLPPMVPLYFLTLFLS